MSTSSKGFTFIELLVVLSIISLLLFITIPRIQGNPFLDEKRGASIWIMGTVQALKQKAVREQVGQTLHVDIDQGRFWASNAAMTAEEHLEAAAGAFVAPDGFRVLDISFPERETVSLGTADIHFYKEGYSDMAIIRAELVGDTVCSFLVEPFLPGAKRYAENISFNQ